MSGYGYPSSLWPAPSDVARAAWPGSTWPLSNALPPLAALPTAPRHVRAHVRAALLTWDMRGLAEVAELVATELATNAVRASEGPNWHLSRPGDRRPVIGICLLGDEGRLRIEVWDQAVGVPVLRDLSADSECGRGLALVDAMTGGHWGWHTVVLRSAAKCVWAEIGHDGPVTSPTSPTALRHPDPETGGRK
jgi:serine/threonine-protein kinase RsbW